ncbi:MAG: PAS domain S-box protein [Caldilinea sp.]
MVDTASLLPILYNGALLLALVFIFDIAVTSVPETISWRRQISIGGGIGLIGVLVMLTPWQYVPGIIFDTRSVLLSLSGLFFGFLPTATAMTITAILRIYQGGGGALTGVFVIVVSALIGLGWRAKRKSALSELSWRELYLFGLIVHIAMLLLMLTLPSTLVESVLRAITVPVLVIYPFVTMLIGRLLSQRKRRELITEALQLSEERYRSYVNNAPYGVFVIDALGRYCEANPSACRITGYPADELLTMSVTDLLPPDAIEQGLRQFQTVQKEGYVYDETPFVRKDGSRGWWSVAMVRLSPTRFLGYQADITAEREAEAARQQSEERYQTIFREMLDGFALHEILCNAQGEPEDYRYLAVNPAFERLTGLRADDVVGRTVLEVMPQIERYWIELYGRVALTREPIHCEHFTHSLGRHFEVTAFSPAPRQFATIFVDVTMRKRAEEELQRRDALLEALSFAAGSFLEADSLEDVLPDILKQLGEAADVSRVYLFQNEEEPDGELLTTQRFEWCAPGVAPQIDNPVLQRASYRKLGFARWIDVLTRGDIIYGNVKEFPDAEKRLLLNENTHSIMVVPVFVERRWWGFIGFEHYEDEYIWSEAEIEALRAVSRALGVTIENLASRLHIQQKADELTQIMNGMPEGLLLLDEAGNVLAANPHARQYLGLLTGDAECTQVKSLGDRPLPSLLTSPSDRWGHLVHAEQRTFEVLAQLIERAPAPAGWVLVIRDITNEVFVQQQLQRQERLAAIGQLAAGIAHDFNNLMSVIILYAQLASQSEEFNERDRERMRVIEEQGLRAAQMIRQILDFSRRTAIERHPLDLLPLFKEQIKLLQRTLPENIKISLKTPLSECFVLADPTRLEQVIMNLALNARDAMPDGGELCISVDTTTFTRSKDAPLPGMTPGRWVRLVVSDTGIGIPPENLERLFEPFFTTKPVGLGTGLGLPQVHGIVGQHGGHITVESTVGAGAVFTIYLPLLEMLTPDASPMKSPIPHGKGRGETILLVEDEAALRSTLAEVLEQWNYHVVVVANGIEALNALDKDGLQPDLILSDVVMPEMSGVALFKTLHRRKVNIPVIFLTGHLRGEELENLRQYGLRAWLPKPPSIEQLAETIAAVLQENNQNLAKS